MVLDVHNGYTVNIETQGKTKQIYKRVASEDIDPYLVGYAISPYNDRAMIITSDEQPSGNTHYRFIGSHLSVGFK